MPRPKKCRKVCCLPQCDLFGPLSLSNENTRIIQMTVDEYEAIRLIDLEGLQQEECAEKMDVARTTVQRIYNDARKKLAEALVNGSRIKIEGGDVTLCNRKDELVRCQGCKRK